MRRRIGAARDAHGAAETAGYSLGAAPVLAFLTAVGSGPAKLLPVDAVIQELLPDESRASAFTHSETPLQVPWVGLVTSRETAGSAAGSLILARPL